VRRRRRRRSSSSGSSIHINLTFCHYCFMKKRKGIVEILMMT
jgi:hypothetical protein